MNDVRAVIPERCYQPSAARSTLAVIQGISLWLAPVVALVLTSASWWSVLFIGLVGMAVAGLFVLGHDASHGALYTSNKANALVARWCMVPSLHNESAWGFGHNRIHHGFTTRLGFDFVWQPLSPAEFAALSRFGRMRHRFEWSWLGSGAYYAREVWWNKMMFYRPEGKRAATYRRDNWFMGLVGGSLAVVVGFVGLVQGGPLRALWLIAATLLIPFAMFCQVIGWTVYVHHIDPKLLWWPRREWTQFKGQMESTTVIDIPWVINKLWFHDIFVHMPHHVDPRISFYRLREASKAIETAFPGVVRHEGWNIGHYFAATRQCKLFDADERRWVKYPTTR